MAKISAKFIFIISFIMAFNFGAVFAADDDQLNCNEPITQMDMNQCAHLAYIAADEDLNFDYDMALEATIEIDSYLSKDLVGAKQALLDAQRAWLKYRDTSCKAEGYSFRGGSMEPLIVSSCKERLTRQRSEDLRSLYEQN